MVGIVVAMEKEAKGIIEKLSLKRSFKILDKTFYENGDVCLAISGVGKVNAGVATAFLTESRRLEGIINFGFCGAKNADLSLYETVCINYCIQGDFDLSPLDDSLKKGELNEKENYCENLITVEGIRSVSCFTADRIGAITGGFDVEDMELGAILQIAAKAAIPVIALKTITNYLGRSAANEYGSTQNTACEKLTEQTLEVLEKYYGKN